MIPALCCDEGLYEDVTAALSDLVSPRIIIPYAATLKDCADQVLKEVNGDFIIMGTSFGGHVAREVALAQFWRNQLQPMTVDEQGVWSVTVGPLTPEVYSYQFRVDGLPTADPMNPRVKLGRTTIG